jgi:hypothetical protein
MAAIEDPTPPPPKRYVENSVETGSGRQTCISCGKVHGSVNGHISCLSNAVEGLRLRVKRINTEHAEEIAHLKVMNRAAVESARLPATSGGQTEARMNAGKK